MGFYNRMFDNEFLMVLLGDLILRIKGLEYLADVYKTSKIILEIIRLTTLNTYYMPYIVYYLQ